MTCCLCGGEIQVEPGGWAGGHNPAPLANEEGERCCSDCNRSKVVPERLRGGRPLIEVLDDCSEKDLTSLLLGLGGRKRLP